MAIKLKVGALGFLVAVAKLSDFLNILKIFKKSVDMQCENDKMASPLERRVLRKRQSYVRSRMSSQTICANTFGQEVFSGQVEILYE